MQARLLDSVPAVVGVLAVLPVLAFVGVLAGCHANARIKAKASTSDEPRSDEPRFDVPETPAFAAQTTAAPAAAPAPAQAAAPVTASAPPEGACPLHCYEARGSEAIDLPNEEVTQLRSALEPVFARMRSCVTAEEWRRDGSSTVNLRIAPDGTLAELGIDPGHGDGQGEGASCFDDAGRGATASVALPGHKVVRCTERCASEKARRGGRRAL